MVCCTCCTGYKLSAEGVKLDQSLLETNKQACCGGQCGFSWRAPAVSHRRGSNLSVPLLRGNIFEHSPCLSICVCLLPPLSVCAGLSLFHCHSKPIMYDIFILRGMVNII